MMDTGFGDCRGSDGSRMDQDKPGIIDFAGEKLKQLQGKVFHAVVDNNRILQYRISQDGKLILEKTIKTLHLADIKEKSTRLLESATDNSKRRWRKVVTGDPDKRIRDHMKETPQVKFVDKLSFTLGVIVIVLSEWIALRIPSLFPKFYILLMSVLLTWRYISYKADKCQFFMLDFCYFVNSSVALQYFVAPGSVTWFRMNYVLSMGPLCCGIIVWRNSLVFHSLDKVTSFFLHALPPMTMHLTRWNFIPDIFSSMSSSGEVSEARSLSFFGFPLLFYFCWQGFYLFLTEFLLADKLEKDPEIVTALRYLSQDRKSPSNKKMHELLRRLGVLMEEEHLDAATLKCKIVFVCIQLVYTLATISHVKFLYGSYALSCAYLAIIFTWGTWNGASYYIEVFSKRYNIKFENGIFRKNTVDSESQTGDENDDERDDDDDFKESEDDFLTPDVAKEIYTALGLAEAEKAHED